LQGLAI